MDSGQQTHTMNSERASNSQPADHDHSGHSDHVAIFRRLFWIMLALAVPTVLASQMFADIIGYALPDIAGIDFVSPVLGTIIFAWGGKPFLIGARDEFA
ncbi:MAG TPA: heavy metal translocating P-type ATPase, partial [Aeromicrobium sp.]|nr:heavy metal translocating P-type ATPase [Aeromicrobium sp.]